MVEKLQQYKTIEDGLDFFIEDRHRSIYNEIQSIRKSIKHIVRLLEGVKLAKKWRGEASHRS
jgi:hypothetical protein